MIETLVDARLFKGQHVKRLLDDTDDLLVAVRIVANGARVGFGNIEALRAIDNALLDARNRLCETACLVRGTTQDKEGEALSRFDANARQL